MYEISVICPIYNVEKYLSRCIDSVLGQTFTNFELILVDDGSSDGCPTICDEYAKKDHRISVIHQKNGGSSSARNAGLNLAGGGYIVFIDSDDYIHPEYLKNLFLAITESKSDMAYCLFKRVYEETESNFAVMPCVYKNKTMCDLLQEWHYVEINVVWNKIYKRSLFENPRLRFPNGIINEDEYLKPDLFEKIKSVSFVPQELYFYQQRKNSIQREGFTPKRLNKILAIQRNIQYFQKHNLKQELQEEYEYFCLYYFRYVFQAMHEAVDIDLRRYKQIYNSVFPKLMKSKAFTMKYKYMLLLYFLTPKLCERRYGASYREVK